MVSTQVRVWVGAVLVTAALLALFGQVVERAAFVTLLEQLSWGAVAAGLLLLQGEGLATSLRLCVLAHAGTGLRTCLAVTARWVVGLAVLPARLGEIYGVHLMSRQLALPVGHSLNALFVQRLFDALVLAVLGVPLVVLAGSRFAQGQLLALLAVLALLLVLVVLRLPWCFALLARLVYPRRRRPYAGALAMAALHGRRAARRTLVGNLPLRLVLLTVAKWLCNIAGIALLLRAVLPSLGFAPASLIVIAGNVAAIIPVSGVGGVGLGDVTYAGSLIWYGVAATSAAAAALCIRVALLAAPLLFCAAVLVSEMLWPLREARTSWSPADAR